MRYRGSSARELVPQRSSMAGRFATILATVFLAIASVLPASTVFAASPDGSNAVRHQEGPKAVIDRGRSTLIDAARLARAHPRKDTHRPKRPTANFKGPKSGPQPTQAGTFVSPRSSALTPRIPTAAPPVLPMTFAGLAESDDYPASGLQLEPPDPWVAVNSSYVIQAVNSLIRVTTRSGVQLATLPHWALFGLPGDQEGADARIIWDASHGRWVGVLASFNGTLTDDFINLVVSETADPLGAWDRFATSTGANFPDYPGLASSTDRIVVTADEFHFPGEVYQFGLVATFPWAPILAGGSLTEYDWLFPGTFIHVRPAQVLSPIPDVHLIWEDFATGDVWYGRMTGPATAPTIPNIINLTSALALPAFSSPVAPHNANGTTIADAVDERPTDAVIRNNRMWFVSTHAFSGVDVARVTQLNVSNPASPVVVSDFSHWVPGADIWMPGIGVTADGSAIAVMTASVVGSFNPMTIASRWTATDDWNTFYDIYDQGSAAYSGTRWGDYLGVAADPAASDAVWASDEVATSDGSWRTSVFQFAAPAITSAPTQTVFVPSTLPTGVSAGQTVPVRVSWGASTAGDLGAHFNLQEDIDAGGWRDLSASLPTNSVTLPLLVGHSYQFQVRVVNGNFEPGEFVPGPVFTPTLYQQTSGTAYSSGWSSQSSSVYSGGSVKYASTSGRSATFTATNARSIAIVTTKAKTRGSFKVYVDGVLKGTIKTYSTTTKYRQTVFQYAWSTPGTHKFKIVVSGTSGHPRVDVDAFVVLR